MVHYALVLVRITSLILPASLAVFLDASVLAAQYYMRENVFHLANVLEKVMYICISS